MMIGLNLRGLSMINKLKPLQEVKEKLDEIDHWRGDPVMRRRNCMPRDHGKIQALCWVLGISMEEWDNQEIETKDNDAYAYTVSRSGPGESRCERPKLTLGSAVCDNAGLKPGDSVDVFVEDGNILVQRNEKD